jgi:hypothetical protein
VQKLHVRCPAPRLRDRTRAIRRATAACYGIRPLIIELHLVYLVLREKVTRRAVMVNVLMLVCRWEDTFPYLAI